MVAKLADGTPINVGVYKAYRNAGLSHNQAMAITAEVGRENSFDPSVLFNTHTDPAGRAGGGSIRNVGMLSWNQGRDIQALNYMKRAGVLGQQSQANLNAQAAYSVAEMKGAYRNKLQSFWNNPNASPESFARELGKNYIGWAYGQNTIRGKIPGTRVPFNWQREDNRRRSYLAPLAKMLGDKGFVPQGGSYQAQSVRPVAKSWAELTGQSTPTPKPVAKSWAELTGQASTPKPVAKSWNELTGSTQSAKPAATSWEALTGQKVG